MSTLKSPLKNALSIFERFHKRFCIEFSSGHYYGRHNNINTAKQRLKIYFRFNLRRREV